MRSGRAIGVVSRAPAPGAVKSRLALKLGDQTTAALYAAFLRDVLVAACAIPGAQVSVFHPAEDDAEQIVRLTPPGATVRPESGKGYGEILPNALRQMLADAKTAALLGADSPGLPASTIGAAFDAIEGGDADAAICPTSDGGFCLLAVNGDYPELFQRVDWSTERVFTQVLANAERLGLRVERLPEWYDIDTLQDLERLTADLAGNVRLGAAATRAALRTLRNAGVKLPAGQQPWHVEQRKVAFDSPWRSLVVDEITTHLGERIAYAYLETERAVWVVPLTDDGRIIMVRQYRHPIREIILEVPAGGGEEDVLEIAERELREETGGIARKFIQIASYFPASAHTSHEGFVVLAIGVQIGPADLESTELLDVMSVPAELAFDMARRGEIEDSQSALAILAAEAAIRVELAGR